MPGSNRIVALLVRIDDYGAVGSEYLADISVPEPQLGQIRVRIAAASANPLDTKLISGARKEVFPLQFPYTLGTDIAGTIDKVGPLVGRWTVGERVVARLEPVSGGGLAECSRFRAQRCGCAGRPFF